MRTWRRCEDGGHGPRRKVRDTRGDGGRLVAASTAEADEKVDVVMLSNGPGEVATWVRAVADALDERRARWNTRTSLMLAPCAHASGKELALAQRTPGLDRAVDTHAFMPMLLRGRTPSDWTFASKGVVVFLGGEQTFAIAIAKRLGYPVLIYAEDRARWTEWGDAYALRSQTMLVDVPAKQRNKCRVVGDLLQAAARRDARASGWKEVNTKGKRTKTPVIGILPGSKRAKIAMGVPYMMAVACALNQTFQSVHETTPRFVLPLAPTVTLEELAQAASTPVLGWASATMEHPKISQHASPPGSDVSMQGILAASWKHMHANIEVWCSTAPAYGILAACDLCVTTVGTNTAELAALGTPMVVALPTHDLTAFRGASGGILGLLAQAPGPLGEWVARATNTALLKANLHLSWPNMWAGTTIVPEMVGLVEPEEVADQSMALLRDEDRLSRMSKRLQFLSERAADGERTDLPLEEIDALAEGKDREKDGPDAKDAADLVADMILELLDQGLVHR